MCGIKKAEGALLAFLLTISRVPTGVDVGLCHGAGARTTRPQAAR